MSQDGASKQESQIGQNLADAGTQLKDGAVVAGQKVGEGAQNAYNAMAEAISGGGEPGTADQDAMGAMKDGAARAQASAGDAKDEAQDKAAVKKEEGKDAAAGAAVEAEKAKDSAGAAYEDKKASTKADMDVAAQEANKAKNDMATKMQEGLESIKS